MTTQSTDELVKRLRSYVQNNEMIGQHFTESGRGLNEAADTIESLQREVEAMREGAEQLKFLCSRMFAVELSPDGQHKWIFRNKPLVGENVQAAIDAARSEGEKP